MQTANTNGTVLAERKTVSISSKRQITIPQKFYSLLGFSDEAECIVRGNELIIRPVKNTSGGEFAEMILADLIKEGLSGEELLAQFKEKQTQIRPAVESMLDEATAVASGTTEYLTYNDIFGTED